MKRAKPSRPSTPSYLASQLNINKMRTVLVPLACLTGALLFCIFVAPYLLPAVVATSKFLGKTIWAIASTAWKCVYYSGWSIGRIIRWSYIGVAFLPGVAKNYVLSYHSQTSHPWLRTIVGWLVYLVAFIAQGIAVFLLGGYNRRKHHYTSPRPTNPNECVVCCCTVKPEKRAKLTHRCNRTLCSSCLKHNIQQNLGTAGVDDRFQKCPAGCSFNLKESDLVSNGVPAAIVEKFVYFTMHKHDSRITCTNPECKTENFYKYQNVMGTSKTGSIQCYKCATHINIKQDESLIAVSKPKGWKPCPGCGEMVERISGCNNMHHVKCGAQWCYPCGKLKLGHGPTCK